MKKNANGGFDNAFFQTNGGQLLKNLVEKGLKLDKDSYYIDYAYNLVPQVITRDNSGRAIKYKPPTQAEIREESKYLFEKIVKDKPDIIIPSGGIGTKLLIDKTAITQVRGVPEKVTVTAKLNDVDSGNVSKEKKENYKKQRDKAEERIKRAEEELESHNRAYGTKHPKEKEQIRDTIRKSKQEIQEIDDIINGEVSHEVWVLPMFSMEYMLHSPSVQNLIESDMITLQKFIEQGEEAFQASDVDYNFVDTIEEARKIFLEDVPKAPIVSWDLETNTLKPEYKGAKILVVTIATTEGEGNTIPLEHKDFTWKPEELEEIYGMLRDMVADPNITKVGHNVQYDIRFLMLTQGFKEFANHRDTKIMYYLLINQEEQGSLRLSDLAYELTDMGGYDKPMDDYRDKYIKDYREKRREEIDALRAEHREKVKMDKARAKREGRKYVTERKTFPKVESPKNEIDGGDFNFEWFPLKEVLHYYASGDVDAGLRIHNKLDELGKKPENKNLRYLYTTHYPELTRYLAKIEANGVQMDTEYTEGLAERYLEEEERLEEVMREHPIVQKLEDEHRQLYERGLQEWTIPKQERDLEVAKLRDRYKNKLKFNPNANVDKQRILFDLTGIRLPYNREYLVDSATENNLQEDEIEWFHYKTNKVVLNYIKEHHKEYADLAELLLTHSLVKTRRRGFTYKLREMVDEKGLLHGQFNSTGTGTTRLSSRDPNLQQIPRNTQDPKRFDYKNPIKRMFVSRFEGGSIIEGDYSGLESRLLALAAKDEEMTKTFLEDGDIHSETASLVFNRPVDSITNELREAAKATTFGISYGETPYSYYGKHDMSLKEAETLFDNFFRNKPKIKQFIDETHEKVKKDGYIETLHGFRRNLRDVYSQDRSKQNEALRQAVNTRIQGTGAFLTNTSVIFIQKWLEKNNMKSVMVLTVHDSVVVDAHPEEITVVAKAVKYIMENLPIKWLNIEWEGKQMRYPLEADIDIGVTYNDVIAYEEEDFNTFESVKGYCRYYLDIQKIRDYRDADLIDEDKYEELTSKIEKNKHIYQNEK